MGELAAELEGGAHWGLFGLALTVSALGLLVYMAVWWGVALRRGRADCADIAWGGGFVLVAWLAMGAGQASLLGWILNGLVTLWGVRLMWHIGRQHTQRGEDFRYQAMRQRWGSWTPLILATQVFGLQGLILLIVALPIIWIHSHPIALPGRWLEWVLPLWGLGFFFEVVGDAQMARFRAEPHPKGAICQSGLWSISRHPNYFGELVQWWAIWVLSCAPPGGYWLIVSPLLLSLLILFASGVKPVEEAMQGRPGWSEYAARTPQLVPNLVWMGALSSVGWVGTLLLAARGDGYWAASWCLLTAGGFWWGIRRWSAIERAELPTFLLAAVLLGFLQESAWIQAGWVAYVPHQLLGEGTSSGAHAGLWPPVWICALYVPFAVGALTFFRQSSLASGWLFVIGALGGPLAYASGVKLGAAQITLMGYLAISVLWGALFSGLGAFYRALHRLGAPWQDPAWMGRTLTVCFDARCPLCMREMKALQKRKQLGRVNYLAVADQQDLDEAGLSMCYAESMKALHAQIREGETLIGVPALAELYARTDHQVMAVFLQAPGFRLVWALLYAGWARVRPRS